jgi:hypothetical protein
MNWLKQFLCSWTHGGGHIKRDSQDRINWQCQKCGRWADPVPLETEHRQIAKDIAAAIRARGQT